MGGVEVRGGVLALAVLAACGTWPYQPLPVSPPAGLPADAFARARGVLLDQWGGLTVDDEAGFRMQTGWRPYARGETPARERATVFRAGPGSLGVMVEVSYLQESLFGDFAWSAPRGDPSRERELGEALEVVLR